MLDTLIRDLFSHEMVSYSSRTDTISCEKVSKGDRVTGVYVDLTGIMRGFLEDVVKVLRKKYKVETKTLTTNFLLILTAAVADDLYDQVIQEETNPPLSKDEYLIQILQEFERNFNSCKSQKE